ncbi:MAG: ABC transporter permease [Chloroflexi bacterium]|nr:ABC transporter permease [Chloroflexota bacterium]
MSTTLTVRKKLPRLRLNFDWRLLFVPVLGLVIYIVWVQVVESGRYPAFILPHPHAVWERFIELVDSGSLVRHVAVTTREALTGLIAASILGVILGYIIARVRLMDYLLTPYLIFLQAIPIIAISPLIIIWFGSGYTSKAIIAGLITWFPMLISTIVGIRNVSPELRELMKANVASPLQILWHLEIPSALPELLGGVKIAVTLSVIGAAVGEFVSAREGLGYLVFFGRSASDTPLVFVGVFLLTALSLLLYGLVAWLEYMVLAWRRVQN